MLIMIGFIVAIASLLLLALRDEIQTRRFDNYLRNDAAAWMNAYTAEHSQTTVLLNGHEARVDVELAQTLVNMSWCTLALDVHTWSSCRGNPDPFGSHGYIAFTSRSGRDLDCFKVLLRDAICNDLGHKVAPASSSLDGAFWFIDNWPSGGRRCKVLALYWNPDVVRLCEIELLSIHLVKRCASFSRLRLEAMEIRDIGSSRPLTIAPRFNRVAGVIAASVKVLTRRPA